MISECLATSARLYAPKQERLASFWQLLQKKYREIPAGDFSQSPGKGETRGMGKQGWPGTNQQFGETHQTGFSMSQTV